MQIKKFEAPTIQEALDAVKRELGPEAIILQTKQNKKGFGLMSKSSVEITAAVSDRALQKKDYVDSRIPEKSRNALNKLPAQKQAEVYDKYGERYLDGLAEKTKEKVELSKAKSSSNAIVAPPAVSRQATASPRVKSREVSVDSRLMADLENVQSQSVKRRVTSTRYADIDESTQIKKVMVSNDFSSSSTMPIAPERSTRSREEAPSYLPQYHAQPSMTSFDSGTRLEEEVKQLKRIITEIKTTQAEGAEAALSGAQAFGNSSVFSVPTLQTAYENLVLNGVDKRFAAPLIKKVAFELGPDRSKDPDQVIDQIAFELMEGSETLSALSSIKRQSGKVNTDALQSSNALTDSSVPSILALVGPTGVGKTTTLAKIASEALLKRNLKVGFINLDSYKVAAFDQLATYAKILNVPFRSVASAEDFVAAIHDFKSLDLILIDTTGRSQKDPESLKEMETLLNSIPGVQTELVLSATTRDLELYDIATRFSIFKPQGLIFSKLDEATVYGAVYNVSQKAKLPLVYFTTGQRVPEDLEEATPERVAALILDL